MKTKLLVPAVLALTLSLPAISSIAATPSPLALLGDPAPPSAAAKTITITPNTRYVNVDEGQVVNFDVGGKTFGWDFDEAVTVQSFDLNRIAPPGTLDHEVRVYISPIIQYEG